MTSSSTSPGCSLSTCVSASAPFAAVTTVYPFTVRRSASSFTLTGMSSTTRIFSGMGTRYPVARRSSVSRTASMNSRTLIGLVW